MSDDDDFCDFTPPNKVKEPKSKKRKQENEKNVDEIKLSTQSPPEKKDSRRLSVEERKFQRELELAMELSVANSETFQGFNKENESEDSNFESFSPLKESVVEVEVHSIPSDKIKEKEIGNMGLKEQEIRKELNSLEMRLHPLDDKSLKNSPPVKRVKKKVNFVEDDSSSESENEIHVSSETDESDYFPSPLKQKGKKASKPPLLKKKNSKINKQSKPKPATSRSPLKVKQLISDVATIPPIQKKTILESDKTPARSSAVQKKTILESCNTPSTIIQNTLESSSKTTMNCNTPYNRQGQFNRPFKSPVIGSSSTNIESSNTSVKCGLRLGLSRKSRVKPLHPNVSIVDRKTV